MLSSLAISPVVLRGLASMMALVGHCQFRMAGHYTPLSSRFSSPLQNLSNHHCTVRSSAVPGPNKLLMLRVVSAVLLPILANKKTAQICFLSNIISTV